jgi:hypothetical protein
MGNCVKEINLEMENYMKEENTSEELNGITTYESSHQ